MRKIEKEALMAFNNNVNFKKGNTKIEKDHLGNTRYYLHSNLIAKKNNSNIEITTAQWNSVTTKNKLNSIGANIQQVNFLWFLNGKKWDSEWININKWKYDSTIK